jgi:pimeloyl-ACP methyl ester carboxylesterase
MRPLLVFVLAFVAIVSALVALIGRVLRRRETLHWRDAPAPGRIVEVDGVGIHYVEQGSGPAVLLIHGFGGHTYSFRYTIPALATDYRVIAADLMGFGYSERPGAADYSLTAHAARMLRLMDELGIDRAAVVGHSMGGEVAMRMAAMAPERIVRVVLAGSVSGDRIPTLPVTPIIKPFLPAMRHLVRLTLLHRAVYDPAHLTPEVRDAYLAPTRLKGSIEGIYQLFKDARSDRKIEYSRIKQPVLVLWADHERVVPRAALRRIQQHLPQADVVVIERAGHLLLEEQPDPCNTTIRGFLQATERESVPIDATAVAP